MGHIARVFQRYPFHLGDVVELGLDALIRCFIISSIQEKRLCLNSMCVFSPLPVLKRADDHEFRGSLPSEQYQNFVIRIDSSIHVGRAP